MKVSLGHFVKSSRTITNLPNPSLCGAWSFPLGAEWAVSALPLSSTDLSVCLSCQGVSQGGCYQKGPICYPGFTTSPNQLFAYFIYQGNPVNASYKMCVQL